MCFVFNSLQTEGDNNEQRGIWSRTLLDRNRKRQLMAIRIRYVEVVFA